MMRRALLPSLLTLLAAAPAAGAQSLLGGTGLGLPLSPIDARAWALGGTGIGLDGASLGATDPAAAADLAIPSLAFTLQSSWVDLREAGGGGEYSGTRFPSIHASYPVRGLGTMSVGFSSVLDQRWMIERQHLIDLDGVGGQARVTDSFVSDGGVSAVRLGWARRIAPSLALGAQVGTHLGQVTRRFTRSFDSLDVAAPPPAYSLGGLWTYSGPTASVGAALDLGDVVRVAGSYTWSGDLEAEPSRDTQGSAARFSMPREFRLGAMASLTPGLELAAGVHRADWSTTTDDLPEGEARSIWAYGGGLEWSTATILGKPGAVRVGYRRAAFPFVSDASDEPFERAYTGGISMDLLRSEEVTLARLDLTLERGLRQTDSIEESFWRLVTSVRVSSF